MKKIILLLLLIPFIAFSQDCKFEKNEIDPFNKNKVIQTYLRPIAFDFIGNGVDFQFLYDNDIFIICQVNYPTRKVMETKPENNIMLLLNNENVIKFNIGEIVLGKMEGDGGLMSSTKFKLKFKTSIEDLISIKNIGIKKIRFEYSEGSSEFEVSKQKFIDKTNNTINCFINEIKKQ